MKYLTLREMNMRIPWRQLIPRADAIVAALWAEPTITKKAQVKALSKTELVTLTGFTSQEIKEVVVDWGVLGPRHLKEHWQDLNDLNVVDPAFNTEVASSIVVGANHGLSPQTAIEKIRAACDRAEEVLNG